MAESFFAISLSSLRIDSIPTFDLYIRHLSSPQLVLFREKSTPFTGRVLQNLIDNKHEQLFVPRDQRDDYFEYSSRLVADMVANDSVPAKEKSQVVYSTVTNIMEDLFATPRSSTRIRQARETVRTMVDFIVRDEQASRNLIFLTCHDYYTYTHSVNVSIFATTLAEKVLGPASTDHDLWVMGEGFLLHDIGKSMIPPSIINKPGKLNEHEWALMKQHPEQGRRILEETHQINQTIEVIVCDHHERPDGSGYPRGLVLEEIHPYAKICCIADVFDAMTTVRSYRDPLSTFDALAIMRDEMSAHFDRDFFNEFVMLFREQ